MTPLAYQRWAEHLDQIGPGMTDQQMEACADLITVLLCGEQSAVSVFAKEVASGRAPVCAMAALQKIERDERLHEAALLRFETFLPTTKRHHQIKRRAQRFFFRLGRADSVGHHFARVAHLDSAVCKIMHQVERSAIQAVSPLKRIAMEIKHDEARHVAVSRNYAHAMGVDRAEQRHHRAIMMQGLTDLLHGVGDAFEVVGVDSDRLFRRLHSESTL